ncbi:enterobactin synthetase component D [Halopseudomonas sabulinigri]|uniref:Enterobactin synthase component D n=1 Tax=Halopseudomonas sabulinigri TaxID=472181 RepID=A0A1H1UHH2_9GAMM|nr:4'-phosphopantetheinyl transferase superfamily protein [Halopseudomonas sabulinigri]SDS71646.1 enterobactin synthetase component D [Halopseudomonas sabulinigri]
MLNSFVTERFVLNLQGVQIHALRFAREHYCPALFVEAQLPLPQSVERSVAKRQAEFLAGRLAARSALAGLSIDQPVDIGESRAPLWPAGAQGSISHSAELALCVVRPAQGGGLGVDLESLLEAALAEQLWPGIVTAQEAQLLRQSGNFAQQLTLVFSAKESLFKALYPQVGRYFDFLDAEVLALQPQQQQLQLVLRQSLSPALPAGSCFTLHWLPLGNQLLTLLAG